MAGRARNWLVLSLKWSRSDDTLVWHGTNDSGYQYDLMRAGRYTQEEAIQRQEEGVTLAVPLDAALGECRHVAIVPAENAIVERLKEKGRTCGDSR